MMIVGTETGSLVLNLHWKSFLSGSYPWTDEWRDSSGFGCRLTLTHSDMTRTNYRSTSGQTNVKFYTSGQAFQEDSLFGSFCGYLKDSMGNTITINHGKFYELR